MADGEKVDGFADPNVVVLFSLPKATAKRMGRRHIPTESSRLIVQRAYGMGMTLEQTSELIGIDTATLVKHYKKDLENSAAHLNFNVSQNLYRLAMGSDRAAVTASMFWLKCRAGWREVQRVEHTGPDGGPIQHQVSVETIDPRDLTQEEREQLMDILHGAMERRMQPAIEGEARRLSAPEEEEENGEEPAPPDPADEFQ